jgi:hypothetical protein
LSAVGPLREQMFERRLIDANRFVADYFFIDPAHSPSAGLPTAVTYGAPSAASTGDVAQDLELLIENFGGDLSTASIVTSPWVATRIALQKDTSGVFQFADVSPRGGSLLGFPLICSRAVPADTSGGLICLIDGAGIALAREPGGISASTQTMIEQDTAPQGASDTPTAASATLVSMFLTDSTAIKIVRRINWAVARPGSVSCVTGAAY